MEIWKPVAGFDGYEVSNLGRGYLCVNLWRNGNSRKCKVQRLVAEAFVPNPESKPEVNRINGNKADNRVENPEWATARENTRHAIDTGLLTFSQRAQRNSATFYQRR